VRTPQHLYSAGQDETCDYEQQDEKHDGLLSTDRPNDQSPNIIDWNVQPSLCTNPEERTSITIFYNDSRANGPDSAGHV
jgi:hypothetical protein